MLQNCGMSGQYYQKIGMKWGFLPDAHYPVTHFLLIETVVRSAISMYDCLKLNSKLIILVDR